MNETELIKHLHAEKISAEEQRAKYTLQKLIYATALLGIGSINIDPAHFGTAEILSAIGPIKLGFILYLVPVVAIAFDLYILAEDYSVKRIGAFLGKNSPDSLEHGWEQWVSENRDRYAPAAMPILTVVLVLAAAIAVWAGDAAIGPHILVMGLRVSTLYWVWLAVAVSASCLISVYYWHLRKRVLQSVPLVQEECSRPPMLVRELQASVERANHSIDSQTYQAVRRLFSDWPSKSAGSPTIQETCPEYGKSEFLLCVEKDGSPVRVDQDILLDFQELARRQPESRSWFQQVTLGQNKESVLLIARWLCHLAGFRHRAVHLFIDHPTADEYTLVQIRGFGKTEAPGCFDLPAAGHVIGLDTMEDALLKELEEELGLCQDDIAALQPVGSYEYCSTMDEPGFRNVEFRAIYASRLKVDTLDKARFLDHEVAALSVFSLSELETLVERFPDRIASGLTGSFPAYLQSKRDTKQAQVIPSTEEGEIQ